MRSIFRYLRKLRFKYLPLVEILIYRDRLLHNLSVFQARHPGTQVAPVLKSNAYGHGLVQIAKIFDSEHVPFLVVDSYYEALVLRNEGIKTPLLIIGFTPFENIVHSKLKNAAFTVIGLDELTLLSRTLKTPRRFHLKLDTGMHRQGIPLSEIETAIRLIKKNKNMFLEGLCSHLADADGPGTDFTNLQIKAWNEAADRFEKEFSDIKYFHLAATAGSKFSNAIKANVARIGLGLYGIRTETTKNLDLKPVLEMRSIISSVKKINAGEFVGYNLTFEAKMPTKIATVPVGYFEGVDRRLSNVGFFKYKNAFCRILGLVSMNITTIDVSSAPEAKLGDEVIIISANPDDKNSVEKIAEFCGTIPYEILVHIPQHLRRTVI